MINVTLSNEMSGNNSSLVFLRNIANAEDCEIPSRCGDQCGYKNLDEDCVCVVCCPYGKTAYCSLWGCSCEFH